MNPASPIPSSRALALLRDLSAGFTQQMFFWGMDAANPSQNLFQQTGFRKYPSTGIKGTSCYSLPWKDGTIFLHGACAGWLPENGETGFIYIRQFEKCFLWLDSEPPVPGTWPVENLTTIDLVEDFRVIAPLLSWWLAHEAWVSENMDISYRAKCQRKYKSLPIPKPWLAPHVAIAWIKILLNEPAAAPRAKRFGRSASVPA